MKKFDLTIEKIKKGLENNYELEIGDYEYIVGYTQYVDRFDIIIEKRNLDVREIRVESFKERIKLSNYFKQIIEDIVNEVADLRIHEFSFDHLSIDDANDDTFNPAREFAKFLDQIQKKYDIEVEEEF